MSDINQRIANLSPEKRALVERYLNEQETVEKKERTNSLEDGP